MYRYCHSGALALDECYFEPVSSCSLRAVYGAEAVSAWSNNLDEGALGEARKRLHGDRVFFNAVTGQYTFSKIPPQVGRHTAAGGGVMPASIDACMCVVPTCFKTQINLCVCKPTVQTVASSNFWCCHFASYRLSPMLGQYCMVSRLVVYSLSCSGGGRKGWHTFLGPTHALCR